MMEVQISPEPGASPIPELPEVRLRQRHSAPTELWQRLPVSVRWLIVLMGWAFAAGQWALTGFGASWDWRPQVSVTAEVNHRPSNPLGTEFHITNTGRWSLHNVKFACFINWLSPSSFGASIINVSGLEKIDDMSPTDIETRDCGARVFRFGHIHDIDFLVSYEWSVFRYHQEYVQHFSVRLGEKNEFYAVANSAKRSFTPSFKDTAPAYNDEPLGRYLSTFGEPCLKSVARLSC